MNKLHFRILTILFLIILLDITVAYKVEEDNVNQEVHQYIAKEAINIWKLQPLEIKQHANKTIETNIDDPGFDADQLDDIIDGSGEEDFGLLPVLHFWEPDTPGVNYSYDDGVLIFTSSFARAKEIWIKNVIPSYLRGNINESYYWLGRVVHLLEDATVPAHTHLDKHLGHYTFTGDDILEEYTANETIFKSFNGVNYSSLEYKYEDLISGFTENNWRTVNPRIKEPGYPSELFKLFWYTAQKTQYFASDDADRDFDYFGGTWQCDGSTNNLWDNESLTTCAEFTNQTQLATEESTNSGPNVEHMANATIPHAMKSVAGLYRLFDDAVRIDWPTENHDFRRTGFTLLKGDLTSKEVVRNQLDFFLDAANDNIQQVVKPSVADIDADGKMDQVIIVHKPIMSNFSLMFGTTIKPTPKRKWTNPIQVRGGEDGSIYRPPTLADIDNDGKKEIITGNRNGTIYAYDFDGGQPTIKWQYHLEPRFDGTDFRIKFNGGSAVADVDLDGQQEVIVVDLLDGDDEWPGKVYVLNGNTGANETSYTIGNGGAYGSVSIANLDSDDNPEIVVPSQYGIKVLDYNPSTNKLTEKCSNTHAYLWDSAVIYDVDKDNDYELVYVTASTLCAAGKTCENKLHVVNSLTCNEMPNFPITFTDIPRATPTIVNLDSDSNAEIVITMEQTLPDGLGSVRAFDAVTGTQQWIYDASSTLHPGAISPSSADIDNDGNYNIILGENKGSTVYILKNDGNLLFDPYKVVGLIDNGLAIADLDNDGVAEIAFKRAASPETVFVSVSNINTPPEITKISNVTAIVGDLINLSNLISTSDAEGNGITLLYSSPFNSSGQWQTTINDTGNYSILVEASDGNLSTSQFIDVIVFNQTTKLQNQFTDGNTNKLLNFDIIYF